MAFHVSNLWHDTGELYAISATAHAHAHRSHFYHTDVHVHSHVYAVCADRQRELGTRLLELKSRFLGDSTLRQLGPL
jgi:hypothetical protein